MGGKVASAVTAGDAVGLAGNAVGGGAVNVGAGGGAMQALSKKMNPDRPKKRIYRSMILCFQQTFQRYPALMVIDVNAPCPAIYLFVRSEPFIHLHTEFDGVVVAAHDGLSAGLLQIHVRHPAGVAAGVGAPYPAGPVGLAGAGGHHLAFGEDEWIRVSRTVGFDDTVGLVGIHRT